MENPAHLEQPLLLMYPPPLHGSPVQFMFIKDTKNNFDTINHAIVKGCFLSFYSSRLESIRLNIVLIKGTDTMEHASPGPTPVMQKIADTVQESPDKRTLRYKPGDLIIKEGDFGIALYRIAGGTVSIFKELHGQEVLLFELGPGDVFGEMVFIDGGHAPRTASVVAKDAVELEAWHYLALRHEYQAMSPIISLIALDMVKKLVKISTVHDRLRIEKHPKQTSPPETDTAEVNLTVKDPSFTFKLAGDETVGKEWEGLVEYRLPDNPAPAILHATGVDIDEEGMRFDVALANMNHGGHEPGSSIELFIHLADDAPVQVRGEISSISRGAVMGRTALRVHFRNVSAEAQQRIAAFLMLPAYKAGHPGA